MALSELVCSDDEGPPYVRVQPGIEGVRAFERVHQGVVTAVVEDGGRELASETRRGSRYPFGQLRILRLAAWLDAAAEDGGHRLWLCEAPSAAGRRWADFIVESRRDYGPRSRVIARNWCWDRVGRLILRVEVLGEIPCTCAG